MKYGDRGEEVRALQRRLMELGLELPKYGADGDLGKETWAALQLAADRFRIDPLPPPGPGVEIYPDLIDALLAPPKDDAPEPDPLAPGEPPRLIDLRKERVASRPKVRLDASGSAHVRKPEAIIGICLHQTAVRYSVSAQQLAAAGGDRAVALARRALNIAAHAVVFQPDPAGSHGPLLVPCAPLLWHVNHGNGLNPITLGLEVDGLYAEVEGDPRTVWGGKAPTTWTAQMADAVVAMIAWLKQEAAKESIDIGYVYAHRQSSATRRSDPGELIWKTAALPAMESLGLQMDPARIWGNGRPLPAAWGVAGGGKY